MQALGNKRERIGAVEQPEKQIHLDPLLSGAASSH